MSTGVRVSIVNTRFLFTKLLVWVWDWIWLWIEMGPLWCRDSSVKRVREIATERMKEYLGRRNETNRMQWINQKAFLVPQQQVGELQLTMICSGRYWMIEWLTNYWWIDWLTNYWWIDWLTNYWWVDQQCKWCKRACPAVWRYYCANQKLYQWSGIKIQQRQFLGSIKWRRCVLEWGIDWNINWLIEMLIGWLKY